MALFSPPTSQFSTISATFNSKTHFTQKPYLPFLSKRNLLLLSTKAATENGAGVVSSSSSSSTPVVVVEEKVVEKVEDVSVTEPEKKVVEKVEDVSVTEPEKKVEEKEVSSIESNGAAAAAAVAVKEEVPKFSDPRWVGGTWDLKQFGKDGKTNWDSVIDAEVRRRKWLEDNPETSSNDDPVVFDTAIIPWWSWIKRFHLPEAEKLNGRAAMVGFFMAYFVDSLTGVGLVDQMGNFFCKTLLLVAVAGVLLVRKNEDIDNLKKLIDETTFYDKQWQATWQDDNTKGPKKD